MAIRLDRWRQTFRKALRRPARGPTLKSSDTLAAVVDRMNAAIYRYNGNPDAGFEFVSTGIESLTGFDADDFLRTDRTLQSLLSPEDSTMRLAAIRRAADAHRRFDVDYRIRAADGSERWLREQGIGVYDEHGRLAAIDGLLTNLTEHKRAGKEEQFSLLVQWVSDYAIFMINPDGSVSTWNRGAERIHGYSEQEVVGRNYSLFFTPEDQESGKPAKDLIQAKEAGSYEEEGWRVRKDGSRFWGDIVVTAIYHSDGRLAGFAKITRDLTERIEAQATEKRLRQIADVVPSIVWVTAPEGRATYFNRQWSEYTGQDQETCLGDNWLKALHPKDAVKTAAFWRDARAHGRPYEMEVRLKGKDGSYRWFLARGVPIRDSEGRVTAYFGTSLDIDERVHVEKERERYAASLEQAVQERTKRLQDTIEDLESFSYTASHDLRAPLRAIQGFSHMLLRDFADKLDAEGRNELERLARSTERMDELIHDLLVYTTLGKQEFAPERVSLDELVPAIIEDARVRCPIEVRSPLGAVNGQPSMVREALFNLLDNACKFLDHDRKPEISIWTEQRGRSLRVWMKDNGIGIEPKLIPKIFKPFVRGHTGEYPGTGIGLAIVKKSAERLGGTVGAESEVGRGSRFWIELPGVP